MEDSLWVAHIQALKPSLDCQPWTDDDRARLGVYATFEKRRWRPAKLAYRLLRGPIPLKMDVYSTCANVRCLNPAHLYLAVANENGLTAAERRWKYVTSKQS